MKKSQDTFLTQLSPEDLRQIQAGARIQIIDIGHAPPPDNPPTNTRMRAHIVVAG